MVLSPFGFCGSRRQWVVNPRTRVSGALAVENNQPSRPTSAPGARDRRRQPAPRLQKPLEPETTAGNRPRVYKSSLDPETTAGNRPRVYKGSSSCPLRATGPQVWNRIFCPRPPQATGPASSKAVVNQKLEHLGTTSPTVNQPSPFSKVKN